MIQNIRFLFFSFLFITPAFLWSQNLELNTLLSNEIIESSGLLLLNGKIITHNDSGGENALYEIDSLSGAITKRTYIANASNVDWEDICADQNFIYLGDFGNNAGNRTNLKVYRIGIQDYFNATNDSVYADTIAFTYADQLNFSAGSNQSNFDAEAMIVVNDSLYIFTKNWLDNRCNIYALANIPGQYNIHKIDSFNSQGLITGASYNSSLESIVLCGYGPPIPFVILLSNFSNHRFSNGQMIHQLVQVPNGSSVQIESIVFKNDEELFLSSETSVLGNAALFSFKLEDIVTIQDIQKNQRLVYPNPSHQDIFVAIEEGETIECYDIHGQFIFSSKHPNISLSSLAKGSYFLRIKNQQGSIVGSSQFILE